MSYFQRFVIFEVKECYSRISAINILITFEALFRLRALLNYSLTYSELEILTNI